MAFLYLALAILGEIMGTLSLKASNGFTEVVPSILVVIGYGAAFFFMSIVMRSLPVGIVYAIWSGVGMVVVSIMGHFFFKQVLNPPVIAGMLLIVAGVVVINTFSSGIAHETTPALSADRTARVGAAAGAEVAINSAEDHR